MCCTTYTACFHLHIAGRYADDVAAAKAYDKAAVYLYGSQAITNFGLQACLEDPTPVMMAIAALSIMFSVQQADDKVYTTVFDCVIPAFVAR